MSNKDGFINVRAGTEHDLADATALATQLLAKAQTNLDSVTFEFSKDLFVAVSLYTAYSKENGTFKDILDFLVDPSFDDAAQVLSFLGSCDKAFQQKEAALWQKGFVKKTRRLSAERAEGLVGRCHIQWKTALSSTGRIAKGKVKSRSSLQVFNQESVAKALEMMGELKDEKKAGGDRVLENALFNEGYRSVPDTKKAGLKLEEAKLDHLKFLRE